MDLRWCSLALGIAMALPERSFADWLWERRDPQMSNRFTDYRARQVGDLITIVVEESTGFEGQEKREMEKKTNANLNANGKGSSSALGKVLRSFAYDLDLNSASTRAFDGKANSTIDRKFTDRMTVMVVGVQPNGNIVIEGSRQRVINKEVRTLRIAGVVRPADIGAYNTIQSQYIGNLLFTYSGQGPDSNFTNQGWAGRVMNVLWPH